MLSLVLAILGIGIGFFILEVGIIFEIIAFFIAIKQKKKQKKYANYAFYISLIVGALQIIVCVIYMAYTLIFITDINDKAKEKLNEINKKYEAIEEYSNICSSNININNYDSYEEYNTALNQCYDIVDECFDKNDKLDDAKKCADKIKN